MAAVTAIDDMAIELMHSGEFDAELYRSVNADKKLLSEIRE